MKFAHLADCHIGGWREENLRTLSIESFKQAVDVCVERHIGFVLISGDLFDTAMPSIDILKETFAILNKLKENNIDVYMIPGSHDYSPSGKTMLDVLEHAGLVVNVDNKLAEDKTGVKIIGIGGKRGGLDRYDYEKLSVDNITGFKIFMFHTALNEFKPKELEKMEGQSVAILPKNFNYYAGGHVHYVFDTVKENGKLVYPGALFPNNFAELEKYKGGGFYIVDDDLNLEYVDVRLKDVVYFEINADGKNSSEVNEEIKSKLVGDFKDKIVLLRVAGVLNDKISDIKFKDLEVDCYCFLRNTSKLQTKEFEESKVEGNVDEIEEEIIKKHIGQFEINNEEELTKQLMSVLDAEKEEGEKNYDFEERVVKNVEKVLNEVKS